MDDMDYIMHSPGEAQPAAPPLDSQTAPRWPYIPPMTNRAFSNGIVFDPVYSSLPRPWAPSYRNHYQQPSQSEPAGSEPAAFWPGPQPQPQEQTSRSQQTDHSAAHTGPPSPHYAMMSRAAAPETSNFDVNRAEGDSGPGAWTRSSQLAPGTRAPPLCVSPQQESDPNTVQLRTSQQWPSNGPSQTTNTASNRSVNSAPGNTGQEGQSGQDRSQGPERQEQRQLGREQQEVSPRRVIQFQRLLVQDMDRRLPETAWQQSQEGQQGPPHPAGMPSRLTSMNMPRVATMLNTSQHPDMPRSTPPATRASPALSDSSSSPSSLSSGSLGGVSVPEVTLPPQIGTTAGTGSSAAFPANTSPTLAHTTLDRTFWDSSISVFERESNRVPTASQQEPNANESQAVSPMGHNRRSRDSVRVLRLEIDRHAQTSSESEDEMDMLTERRPTTHAETNDGSIFRVTPQPAPVAESRIRAHQVLRGTLSNRRIASKGAIASLISVEVESLDPSERTCIICYNDFGVISPEGINEAPLRLPKCKHVFGDHCIKKWFEESDSCPYCRDKVQSECQFRTTAAAVQSFIRAQPHTAVDGRLFPPEAYRALSRARYSAGQDPASSSPFSTSQARSWAVGYRREMPEEFAEGQRRTRARHGHSRTSSSRTLNLSNNMPPNTATNQNADASAHNRASQPTLIPPRPPLQHYPQQTSQQTQTPAMPIPTSLPAPVPVPVPVPVQSATRDRCVPPLSQPTYYHPYTHGSFGSPPDVFLPFAGMQMQPGQQFAPYPGMNGGVTMVQTSRASDGMYYGVQGGMNNSYPQPQAVDILPRPTMADGRQPYMGPTSSRGLSSQQNMAAMDPFTQGANPYTHAPLPPISGMVMLGRYGPNPSVPGNGAQSAWESP